MKFLFKLDSSIFSTNHSKDTRTPLCKLFWLKYLWLHAHFPIKISSQTSWYKITSHPELTSPRLRWDSLMIAFHRRCSLLARRDKSTFLMHLVARRVSPANEAYDLHTSHGYYSSHLAPCCQPSVPSPVKVAGEDRYNRYDGAMERWRCESAHR